MATGDAADIQARLARYLPTRWFGTEGDAFLLPYLNAILAGIASCLSYLYSLYIYAKKQTRIKTATDGWLDMISADFFGTLLPRQSGQLDDSYRNAILANLYAIKATRPAMVQVLTNLTGNAPLIVEPRRPADTGSYGGPLVGYSVAGAYGSMVCPYQAFLNVYRSASSAAVANVAGYGIVTGGYGVGYASYVDIAEFEGGVTDSDIYGAINATKPEGTISWVNIIDLATSSTPSTQGPLIGGFLIGGYVTLG